MSLPDPVSDAVTIRAGVPDDAEVLAAFAAHTFSQAFGDLNTPEDLRAHLASAYGPAQQRKELLDPTMRTLLAHVDGRLVGFAQLARTQPPACVTAEDPVAMHRFYLDQSVHGRGVAQRLMAAARDAAQASGGRHLWLTTWDRNARGIAFYRKCGFVDVGETVFVVGRDPQVDRVLVVPLAPIAP